MKSAVLLHDPALPGLPQALEPEAMASRLAPLACRLEGKESVFPNSWRVIEIEILKHTPGRRCALGYLLDGPGGERRLFGKIFSGDRGPMILETLGRVVAAIPRKLLLVPRPVGHLADLGLLLTEYLDGVPLAPSLYQGTSDVPARRFAAALATLHGSGAPLIRRWSMRSELDNTGDWLGRSPAGTPPSSGRAKVLLDELEQRAPPPSRFSEGPVHRDFYPEQVWDLCGQTALLDLDDARCGDPALDVGNFLAHLKLRASQFPQVTRGCERGRQVFLTEYGRRRAGASCMKFFERRVAFYEATSLLRLSGVYSLRERWTDRLPGILLDACEAVVNVSG